MENMNFKTVLKALKKINVSPSKEWQNKTLEKIHSLSQPAEVKRPFILFLYPYTNMKKLLSGVLAVMIVAVGFGYFYSTNTPYAKAQAHLQNIREALSQLESYSETQTVSQVPGSSLFPVAYAETSTTATIAQLIKQIHDEGDAALTEAEKIENAETIAALLAEITKVQNEIVKVLSDVLEKVKDDSLTDTLSTAIEDTANTKKLVDEALDNARQTLKEKNKEFKAEIVAKVKELRATKEEDRLQSAEDLLEALGTSPEGMNEGMQKKYEVLQEILKACDTEGEKCNSGKAHGLAVALEAQIRNQERVQEREDEDKEEDNQYGYDDNDDDKDSTKFQREEEKQKIEEEREQKKQEMEEQREEAKDLKEQEKQELEEQKEAAKDLKEQAKQQKENEKKNNDREDD